MRRILLALTLAAGLLPATISPAWACSCIAVSPEDHAKSAKVVFTGQARSITDTGTTLVTRFTARIVYKGEVPRRLDVITAKDSAACGFPFREDKKFTVFGGKVRNGHTGTNLCTGTTRGGIDPGEYGLPAGERR